MQGWVCSAIYRNNSFIVLTNISGWFPPLLKLDPDSANQGSLHVVDPKVIANICHDSSTLLTFPVRRSPLRN